MSAMLAVDSRLLERPQHPYINRRLSLARRYAVIADHYHTMLATFPPVVCEAVYLGGRYPIGMLRLKDGSTLAIELRRPTGRGREGELCLCLTDARGQPLSSMIFSIADDGRTLLLGCVQGAATTLGREAVRELTRQSHGLRPKNLLLSMLRALAGRYGIVRVRGVANAAHPFAGQVGRSRLTTTASGWSAAACLTTTASTKCLRASRPATRRRCRANTARHFVSAKCCAVKPVRCCWPPSISARVSPGRADLAAQAGHQPPRDGPCGGCVPCCPGCRVSYNFAYLRNA